MKIVAYFHRSETGITVFLQVVDCGDYLTVKIFADDQDWPSKEGYILDHKAGKKIGACFSTPLQAQQWVKEQIDCLQNKLQAWRQLEVPRNKFFEI